MLSIEYRKMMDRDMPCGEVAVEVTAAEEVVVAEAAVVVDEEWDGEAVEEVEGGEEVAGEVARERDREVIGVAM